MLFGDDGQLFQRERSGSFNMTAVIDIVFLLIIFFMVVCQFIEAENFPVAVPDGCKFADSEAEQKSLVTTVTVTENGDERSFFAVGSEQITSSSYDDIVGEIAQSLDARLKDLTADERVVTLRIDKEVRFAEAQLALAGIAESVATDIKLAALKEHSTDSQ